MSTTYPTLPQLLTILSQGATGRFDGYTVAWYNLNIDGGEPTPSVQTLTDTQLTISGGYSYSEGIGDVFLQLVIGSSDSSCSFQVATGGPYGDASLSSNGVYKLGNDIDWRAIEITLNDGSTATIQPFGSSARWYPGIKVSWTGDWMFCFENLSGSSSGTVPADADSDGRPDPTVK